MSEVIGDSFPNRHRLRVRAKVCRITHLASTISPITIASRISSRQIEESISILHFFPPNRKSRSRFIPPNQSTLWPDGGNLQSLHSIDRASEEWIETKWCYIRCNSCLTCYLPRILSVHIIVSINVSFCA